MTTAVVVTFNRRNLLKRCLEHLRRQTVRLDSIIVVNNGSTDGTADWLDSQTDLKVIHQDNVGGSGGFYRGIQQAYDDGYDWIWCMDDDVYPEPDCLEQLLKQDDEKTGMLCPLKMQEGKVFIAERKQFILSNPFKSFRTGYLSTKDVQDVDFVYIEGISFEGPLIKYDVVKRIGFPNKDLFLLYDDSDYSYRTVLAGYQIKLVTKAILNKELFYSNDDKSTIIQKNKWKLYYHIRNTTYFYRKYGKNSWVRVIRPLRVLLQYTTYALKNIPFNRKYNFKDLILFWDAYRDGLKERLGKR